MDHEVDPRTGGSGNCLRRAARWSAERAYTMKWVRRAAETTGASSTARREASFLVARNGDRGPKFVTTEPPLREAMAPCPCWRLAFEPVAEDRVRGGATSGQLRLNLVRADVERAPTIRNIEQIHRTRIAVEIGTIVRGRKIDAERSACLVIVAIRRIDELRRAVDDAVIPGERNRVVGQDVSRCEVAVRAEEDERRLVRLIDDRVGHFGEVGVGAEH